MVLSNGGTWIDGLATDRVAVAMVEGVEKAEEEEKEEEAKD